MNICRISRIAKRGSNPDIVIEVEGVHPEYILSHVEGLSRRVKITLPLLSKEQRYRLASLVFGETDHVDLPCELTVEGETNGTPTQNLT